MNSPLICIAGLIIDISKVIAIYPIRNELLSGEALKYYSNLKVSVPAATFCFELLTHGHSSGALVLSLEGYQEPEPGQRTVAQAREIVRDWRQQVILLLDAWHTQSFGGEAWQNSRRRLDGAVQPVTSPEKPTATPPTGG